MTLIFIYKSNLKSELNQGQCSYIITWLNQYTDTEVCDFVSLFHNKYIFNRELKLYIVIYNFESFIVQWLYNAYIHIILF